MKWLLKIIGKFWDWPLEHKLLKQFRGEVTDELLEFSLNLMRLRIMFFDPDMRRSINGFTARFQFRSDNNVVKQTVWFDGSKRRLKVKEGLIQDLEEGARPDVEVVFKDCKSLGKYLTSSDKDILDLILKNKVWVKGNTNYLLKFMYMERQILKSIGAI